LAHLGFGNFGPVRVQSLIPGEIQCLRGKGETAWQCSREQVNCFAEKAMGNGDGAPSLTVMFLYSLPLTVPSSVPAN
jgi:hypothetical protein